MFKCFLYSCLFVLVTTTGFAQSKKEQIESLSLLVDSLNKALVNSKNETISIQTKANEEQVKLNAEKDAVTASLNAELKKSASLQEQIGTIESNLKKSEEAIALFKQAEEVLKRNNALTSDSLQNARSTIKSLQADEAKLKLELADANKKLTESLEKSSRCEAEKANLETKLREVTEKISLCEAEKATLQSKSSDTGNNYLMNETAVNFNKAKGDIAKLMGAENSELLKVVFSYLDAKYGEFCTENNLTPEDIAEMEESGAGDEGGTFLIEAKVSDLNATFIQVAFTESYYEFSGGEGRFKTAWFFDKSTGIKHEWSNLILDGKKQGLLTLLNKKLKTNNAQLVECGVDGETIQAATFSEYDLDHLTFENGAFIISYNPGYNEMGPCQVDISVSFAEMKPFLNPKYF